MTDTTDIKALRESAESIMNLLENLAGYEPQDIDMDAVELRFEDENGVYTGCDISIVDTAQQLADIIRALLHQLEAECQQREAAEKEREGLQKALVIYGDEILELRSKLANPVVLSDCSFEAVSHMAHWYSEGECVAWVAGAEHVKKHIAAAGFRVREE